jgi:A/G-specific adenine glycosylase
VWLSEIMLQQTRIEAVIPYYERFLAKCPTVRHLAEIDDEALMKLWEGLGYYSRARNLKKAAVAIMREYDGRLPADEQALLSLPGIGEYTAGAIASIAFGLPVPAVDGNVLRVITRLTADESDVLKQSTKRRVSEALRDIYPRDAVGAADMTQALMELGERVCIPNGVPHCDACPLGATCLAHAMSLTDRIPVRAPKKARKIQERTIFLLLHEDKVALGKRPDHGLLAGLWEFIGVDEHLDANEAASVLTEQGISANEILPIADAHHIFTHIEWHMKGYVVRCDDEISHWQERELTWVTRHELAEKYAIPGAYRAFVEALRANGT